MDNPHKTGVEPAAPPAPAITTFKPRSRAERPHSYISFGVRWALITRFS